MSFYGAFLASRRGAPEWREGGRGMTTPQDRLTIEGLRQTVAEQAATIATLRALLEESWRALEAAEKIDRYQQAEIQLLRKGSPRHVNPGG